MYGREITSAVVRPETGVPLERGETAAARGQRISGAASGLGSAFTSAGTMQSCCTVASQCVRAPGARPGEAVLRAEEGEWRPYFQMKASVGAVCRC